MINVTITQVPGPRKDFMLNDGTSVSQALATASISPSSSHCVMVNGLPRSGSHTLHNNDVITITAKVKGNMPDFIEVRVTRVPGECKTIILNGGRTVQHALNQAEITLGTKDEVRVNGRIAVLSHELRANDTVTITAQVKGN